MSIRPSIFLSHIKAARNIAEIIQVCCPDVCSNRIAFSSYENDNSMELTPIPSARSPTLPL
jgi:hypothetical protein